MRLMLAGNMSPVQLSEELESMGGWGRVEIPRVAVETGSGSDSREGEGRTPSLTPFSELSGFLPGQALRVHVPSAFLS